MTNEQALMLLNIQACEDDTEIRAMCKAVLPSEMVDGDTYGVPSVVDLVEMLINHIKVEVKKIEGEG